MRTFKGKRKALRSVFSALVKDVKNLAIDSWTFLTTVTALVPVELLASLILIGLAVLERRIIAGDLDRWIA
jgi:hypothetical protein